MTSAGKADRERRLRAESTARQCQPVFLNDIPTMLDPRLTCKTATSARFVSVKDAWKAVCPPRISNSERRELGRYEDNKRTGSKRLMTLRLSRQALICVTVLL